MTITTSREQNEALVVQITSLVEGYMVWVGLVDEEGNIGNLCKDWAVAMPNGAATSLCHSAGSDAALALAQRLATRFKKQIFVSVDLPNGPLAVKGEQNIVGVLKRIIQ